MSLSRTLQTAKTVPVNGEDVSFELLTIYDIAKIDEARKSQLKAIAKANGKEAGLTAADLYNIAMDIDSRDMTLNELLGYAMTPKGAADVLERSLLKAGKKKEEARAVVELLETVECINLAQQLMLTPKRAKEEPEDPNAGSAGVATVKTPPNDSDSSQETSPTTTSTPTTAGKNDKKIAVPVGFGE